MLPFAPQGQELLSFCRMGFASPGQHSCSLLEGDTAPQGQSDPLSRPVF